MASSYKELDIYNISFSLFIALHKFSMKLPRHEMYELGSQLRRSSNSVCSNIVEGYGRKKYKNELLKFLTYSHASNDETLNHLKCIKELYPEFDQESQSLITAYDRLGGKIHNFILYVINNWRT